MSTTAQRERLRRTVAELLAEPGFYLEDVARALHSGYPKLTAKFADEAKRQTRMAKHDAMMAPRPYHALDCDTCGARFTAYRRDARCCSARCRQRAHRTRAEHDAEPVH